MNRCDRCKAQWSGTPDITTCPICGLGKNLGSNTKNQDGPFMEEYVSFLRMSIGEFQTAAYQAKMEANEIKENYYKGHIRGFEISLKILEEIQAMSGNPISDEDEKKRIENMKMTSGPC